jgi:hypothetical protein
MEKTNSKRAKKQSKEAFEKFVGQVQVDSNLLIKTRGGKAREGWFATISGDCMLIPKNCWHLSTWW